jgi:hypothetical protein
MKHCVAVWWGHEEPMKQGLSATALKESKLNALKEKDRALYKAQLRRLEKKRSAPFSSSSSTSLSAAVSASQLKTTSVPVTTTTTKGQIERAIDSIKVIAEIKGIVLY